MIGGQYSCLGLHSGKSLLRPGEARHGAREARARAEVNAHADLR